MEPQYPSFLDWRGFPGRQGVPCLVRLTRTDFLDDRSLKRGTHSLDDYADFRAKANAVFEARNHNQVGDPDKPGRALVQIANEAAPPLRFVVGVDALKVVDDK